MPQEQRTGTRGAQAITAASAIPALADLLTSASDWMTRRGSVAAPLAHLVLQPGQQRWLWTRGAA